mmetsp:Transcript_20582/g.33210  ORF Transcript_20582/g.33210 Transcript_20582/m.33210 type:complete len:134 (+) Transcript_20582:1783-2184(+)
MECIPNVNDTDRPRVYIPRNPYRTPASFPKIPPSIFDDAKTFTKFSTDTLFFIFYFAQGTQHQYYAARELKRLSWRYHKKYLTWFQRHDTPLMTTDLYERGSYGNENLPDRIINPCIANKHCLVYWLLGNSLL